MLGAGAAGEVGRWLRHEFWAKQDWKVTAAALKQPKQLASATAASHTAGEDEETGGGEGMLGIGAAVRK
jgi:hypothetical protein